MAEPLGLLGVPQGYILKPDLFGQQLLFVQVSDLLIPQSLRFFLVLCAKDAICCPGTAVLYIYMFMYYISLQKNNIDSIIFQPLAFTNPHGKIFPSSLKTGSQYTWQGNRHCYTSHFYHHFITEGLRGKPQRTPMLISLVKNIFSGYKVGFLFHLYKP